MTKVLLVNTNIEKNPYPIPPLGICLLAGYLKPHFEVKIYDGVFDEGRSLKVLVEKFHPDYFLPCGIFEGGTGTGFLITVPLIRSVTGLASAFVLIVIDLINFPGAAAL